MVVLGLFPLGGGSTDSLKENQSENNRSRQSQQNDSALSKSSSQQALVAPNDSSLTAVPLQSHQPTTCNDSAFHREYIIIESSPPRRSAARVSVNSRDHDI